MLGAVDGERSGRGARSQESGVRSRRFFAVGDSWGFGDGRAVGGNDWFLCFGEMFADAAQERADPEQGSLRLVDRKKYRLPCEQHDELAELGAFELEEGGWLWCAAPALEEREGG